MKERVGDLWSLVQPGDALVITTNGATTKQGWAVMGRGIALQAAKAFEGVGIRERLGWMIQVGGNHTRVISVPAPFELVAMPVKHHWRDQADLDLIVRSAEELVALADRKGWQRVWMPRPGCGNGRLRWEDVRPLVEPLFDDRFIVAQR